VHSRLLEEVPAPSEEDGEKRQKLLYGMPLYACLHCSQRFETKAEALEHIAKEHEKPPSNRTRDTYPRRVRCCVCDNWCVSPEVLKVHLQMHIGDAELPAALTTSCPICQLTLNGEVDADEHAREHAERPETECGECRQMPPSMEKHALMHADVHAPFFCPACALNFQLRRSANAHVKRFHRHGVQVQERPKLMAAKVEAQLQVRVERCDLMDEMPPPTTLAPPPTTPAAPLPKPATSTKAPHPKTPAPSTKAAKPPSTASPSPPAAKRGRLANRMCPECRRSVPTDQVATHVLRMHAGKPLCHLCLVKLPSLRQLGAHFEQEHPGRVRKCAQCGEFQDVDGMREHVRSAHAHRVACPDCPRFFVVTVEMRKHYRETHDRVAGAKVVACRWCDAEFVGVLTLAEHVDDSDACSAARDAVKL
jgi:hypothetical protein